MNPDPAHIPPTVFVRWSGMVEWLGKESVSVRTIKRMLSAGLIRRFYLPGGTRAVYSVRQIHWAVWKKDLSVPAKCRRVES